MSFVDSYPIVTLPRVSDLPLKSRVVLPTIHTSDETSINLGISKSNISNYIIYPSPRLVWSYSISPSSVIECMDVNQNSSQYYVGITDRNKTFKFLKLSRDEDQADEQAQEYKFKHKITDLKLDEANSDIVWIMLNNGELIEFNHDKFEVIQTFQEQECDEVLFSSIGQTKVVIMKTSNRQIKYKFIQSNNTSVFYEPKGEFLYALFDNYLYKLDKKTAILSKISFNFKVEQEIKLFKGITSIMAPSEDRVVLSTTTKLFIVNIKFNTKLDEFSFDAGSDNELLTVVKVKGNTQNTIDSKLFFLKLNQRKNKLSLNLLNINVGLNNLLSNINKGFAKDQEAEIVEYNDLMGDDYEIRPNTKLAELLSLGPTQDLELEALKYFKNDQISLGYYQFEIGDALVDEQFLQQLIDVFVEEKDGRFRFLGKTPKYLMYYLLTHKLFPSKYIPGLIKMLSKNPKLLKQTIVSVSELPIDEIVGLLVEKTNDDQPNLSLINEILNNLNRNYKFEEILATLQTSLNSGNVDISKLVATLIALNNAIGYKFLSRVIDLNGSLNNSAAIDDLLEFINKKITLVEINSFNYNLLSTHIETATDSIPQYSYESLQ